MSPSPHRVRMILSKKRAERFQLVDERQGPIDEANYFLAAQSIRGLSEHSVRAYAYDLLAAYRFMVRTNKKLLELKQADLLEFVAAQRREKAHPRSINRRLTTLRQLYRFLTAKDLDAGFGSAMPAVNATRPKKDHKLGIHTIRCAPWKKLRLNVPRTLVEPLLPEEVNLFLSTLRRYRDLCMVYLMLLSGLRSKEVLHLKQADLSLPQKQLRIFGKGQKERMLPLADILVQILLDYLRYERPSYCRSEALFVVLQGKRRGLPMTPAGLRSIFRHRRRKKKLSTANAHRFRHTFGTAMARSGVALPVLQKLMGHAFSQTTLQYINLSLQDISAEYQRAMAEMKKHYDL